MKRGKKIIVGVGCWRESEKKEGREGCKRGCTRARSPRSTEKARGGGRGEARHFEIEQRVLEGTRGVPDGKVAVLRTQRAQFRNLPNVRAQCDDPRGTSPKGAEGYRPEITGCGCWGDAGRWRAFKFELCVFLRSNHDRNIYNSELIFNETFLREIRFVRFSISHPGRMELDA